ncbi:hypothetical protein ACOSQ4_005255 [Xanthoceras sorbifolium]
MFKDSQSFGKLCDRCNRMANIPQLPVEELTPMVSPWPFAQWGIDIIGPLPTRSSQKKFAIVEVDYFTNWEETKPVAWITEKKALEFVKTLIIFRFGIPEVIITDHETQFDNVNFRTFCKEFGVSLRFALLAHPQTNGQCCGQSELHPTPQRERHRLALAFGTEAVIPTETTIRTQSYSPTNNDSKLRTSLEELEEQRENVELRVVALQQRVFKYYNSKVRPRSFKVGDLVLKKDDPYEVVGVMGHAWPVSKETVHRDM